MYLLIEEFNMNIHALDGNGKSVIYLSAFHGKTDIVKTTRLAEKLPINENI